MKQYFGDKAVVFSSLSLLQEKRTGACMLANMLDGFSRSLAITSGFYNEVPICLKFSDKKRMY